MPCKQEELNLITGNHVKMLAVVVHTYHSCAGRCEQMPVTASESRVIGGPQANERLF